MQMIKTAIVSVITLTLGLVVAVSVGEAARGGGFRGGGGGGGGTIIMRSGGGAFRGGGGGGYMMRGGGSFHRGGGAAMRGGSSYMRYGGGAWRGGRGIYGGSRRFSGYGGSRRFSGYGGSMRRYAYGGWRSGVRHGKHFRHGDFRHGKRFRHADFDRRHHRRFRRFVGYGFPYYDYGYYYGGDCGWLYRRARITGSPYWWNRYYACINYSY
jgi:hypothetical protein